ncbi:hypothetical protein BC830DRAFT_1168785 [Chytriomyces sp. MP71]|nr:hypothetical protein BC830DRAFT_1168785 [Chytriomyces sp. MP71]
MSTADKTTSSAEELSRKWDQCLSNTLVSTGLGASAGILASVLFFRRKTWPIAFSTGVAVGIASDDCSRSFNPSVTLSHRLHALEGMIPDELKSQLPKDLDDLKSKIPKDLGGSK